MSAQYDARMRRTRYELNNVRPGGGQTTETLGSESQYYADGRVSYAHDLQDDRFDRAYEYDHVGRLKEAYSGIEARGQAATFPQDRPLRQSYTYDVWGNMARTGMTWSTPVNDTPTYTNNRRSNAAYDADGRDIFSGTASVNMQEWYDAAGGHTRHVEESYIPGEVMFQDGHIERNTIEQAFGGDDLSGKRVETRYVENATPQTQVTTEYYLRSSVMGGRVIAEIEGWGTKRDGRVYLGGEELIGQSSSWKHYDTARGSFYESYIFGNAMRRELDPVGQEVGAQDPYPLYNGSYARLVGSDGLYKETGNPFDVGHGCALNGISVSCDFAMDAVNSESAMPAALAAFQSRPGFEFRSLGLGLYRYYVPNAATLSDQIPNNNNDDGVESINTDVPHGMWGVFTLSFPEIASIGGGLPGPQKPAATQQQAQPSQNECTIQVRGLPRGAALSPDNPLRYPGTKKQTLGLNTTLFGGTLVGYQIEEIAKVSDDISTWQFTRTYTDNSYSISSTGQKFTGHVMRGREFGNYNWQPAGGDTFYGLDAPSLPNDIVNDLKRAEFVRHHAVWNMTSILSKGKQSCSAK